MANHKSVWGIDIGQCSLKAIKLRSVEGQVAVEAFDVIEHPKILSQPDADKPQLIANALEQFLARNPVEGAEVAVAVPGAQSFTRFVKLPPVENKRIPSIVKFEAEQQIPFPISEVVWEWQTFEDPDSPDVELGIFAMKREDVMSALAHFVDVDVKVDTVQMAPLALFNFMSFDGQLSDDGATLLADVGAEKTDLVVADKGRLWTRTIHLGGNQFTEALVKAFKLSFAKAEKLKRTAASSKYARQIFQAMRPVFADLVQQIQRSIGYYNSLHRDAKFTKLVGLGNGFRLPGLQKFLEQNLSIPVVRIDSYNRLGPAEVVNTPAFSENVLSFAVAYGLACQGLGASQVDTNLLPDEIAKQRLYARKTPWFIGSAAMLAILAVLPMVRSSVDAGTLEETRSKLSEAKRLVDAQQDYQRQLSQIQTRGGKGFDEAEDSFQVYAHRMFWPMVQEAVTKSIATVARDQNLPYDQLKEIPRPQRRVLNVVSMSSEYVSDFSADDGTKSNRNTQDAEEEYGEGRYRSGTGYGGRGRDDDQQEEEMGKKGRGFRMELIVRTPMPVNDALPRMIRPLLEALANSDERHDEFELVEYPTQEITDAEGAALLGGGGERTDRNRVRFRDEEEYTGEREGIRPAQPDGEVAGPAKPGPFFPEEDASKDAIFKITLLVKVSGDGLDGVREALGESEMDRRR